MARAATADKCRRQSVTAGHRHAGPIYITTGDHSPPQAAEGVVDFRCSGPGALQGTVTPVLPAVFESDVTEHLGRAGSMPVRLRQHRERLHRRGPRPRRCSPELRRRGRACSSRQGVQIRPSLTLAAEGQPPPAAGYLGDAHLKVRRRKDHARTRLTERCRTRSKAVRSAPPARSRATPLGARRLTDGQKATRIG